jgi:hypothetical protein
MSDDKRGRNPLAVWLICAFVVLPIAYVLSPGVVFKAMPVGARAQGFLGVFYWPLGKLYDNLEPVKAFYDWYFTLLGVN